MSGPDVGWWRATAWLCGLGLLFSAAFAGWPALDLLAAAAFHDGVGFPLGDTATARTLRIVYRWAFVAACVGTTAGLLAALAAPSARRVSWRLWAYPVLLFIVGPGLVANALLKENWGRARPAQIEAFGGEAAFTRPFVIASECDSNCSFVSGEGSAAAALAFAGIGLFWARLGPAGRAVAAGATALWLLGAAFIRIAPGRHFLSDTLFAFVLMGLVAAFLYRALGLGPRRAAVGLRDYGRDLAAGALDAARRVRALRRRGGDRA